MTAAEYNRTEIVQLLLKRNARTDPQNRVRPKGVRNRAAVCAPASRVILLDAAVSFS